MLKMFVGVIAAMCCLAPLIKPPALAATVKPDSEEKVIVDAILALSAADRVPQVDRAQKLGDHVESSVESLLLLLDRHNSNEALRQISRLNYYYIGEAPGEIYDCVVVRKSNRIVPFLKAAITSKKTNARRIGTKAMFYAKRRRKFATESPVKLTA